MAKNGHVHFPIPDDLKEITKGLVYLGGVTNSCWRDLFVAELKLDYYNPLAGDFSESSWSREQSAKERAEVLLFVITPKMEGFYNIAELIDAKHTHQDKQVIAVFLHEDEGHVFNDAQWSGVLATKALLSTTNSNHVTIFDDLIATLAYLNGSIHGH